MKQAPGIPLKKPLEATTPNPAPPYLAYSIGVIESSNITDRVPRRRQSRAASQLLSTLQAQTPFATAHSKSHSRAVAAVAIGCMDDLGLGIDIEWTGAERPIASIASYLQWEGGDPVTNEAFYRGWTFAEAYYKAFQQHPDKGLVIRAMTEGSDGGPIRMDDGIGFFPVTVGRDFQLSLVWKTTKLGPVVPICVTSPFV